MKKPLSILGVSVLSVSLLSGCGDSDEITAAVSAKSVTNSAVAESYNSPDYNVSDNSFKLNNSVDTNVPSDKTDFEKELNKTVEEIENFDLNSLLSDTINNIDFKNFNYTEWERAYCDFFAPYIAIANNANTISDSSVSEVLGVYNEVLTDLSNILIDTNKLKEYANKFNAIAKANNIKVTPISSLSELIAAAGDTDPDGNKSVSEDLNNSELIRAYYDFYAPFIAVIKNMTSLNYTAQAEIGNVCREIMNDTEILTNANKLEEYADKFNNIAEANNIKVTPITSPEELAEAAQSLMRMSQSILSE